jgi:hypothetical protein
MWARTPWEHGRMPNFMHRRVKVVSCIGGLSAALFKLLRFTTRAWFISGYCHEIFIIALRESSRSLRAFVCIPPLVIYPAAGLFIVKCSFPMPPLVQLTRTRGNAAFMRVMRVRGVDVNVHWSVFVVGAIILLNAGRKPVLTLVV